MTLYILLMTLNGHAYPIHAYTEIAACRASMEVMRHNEAASFDCLPVDVELPAKRKLYGKL
jgi:hypothetical protein